MAASVCSNERSVIRALFESVKVEYEDVRWRRCSINAEKLAHRLSKLNASISVDDVKQIVNQLSVFVLRNDALRFSFKGFERSFNRQSVAEGLGAAGVQFFPTRQSANRSGYETSREAVYFGSGAFDEQFLTCPISALASLVDDSVEAPVKSTIVRDMRDHFKESVTACEMLARDHFFEGDASTPEKFIQFQEQLRNSPLSSDITDKLMSFFDRRMTIGIRDTLRWSLGARHPKFGWRIAKKHIEDAFARHGQDDFNTPQIVYYAYAPEIDEDEIEETERNNEVVVNEFASLLTKTLEDAKFDLGKSVDQVVDVCRWILDIHHDYPDFDLESTGVSDAAVHIDFIGHSVQNQMSQEIWGNDAQTRRNVNFKAHFDAYGLTKRYLSRLSNDDQVLFFDTVKMLVRKYDEKNGVVTANGICMYNRLPTNLFVIQRRGDAAPAENERVLDSFDLSVMTQLNHASYMRAFADISEQLLVFFVLTLRHMTATDHAPDLRPADLMKDFLMLGLWGTRTPNLHVNLYVDKSLDESMPIKTLTRSEVRFVGCEQVEIHAIDHLDMDAKALRFVVSRCLPLIEPSILRNIGTFTMAMNEFANGVDSPDVTAFSIVHYASDILREIAHAGIKGSAADVISLTEFLLAASIDTTTQWVEAMNRLVNKFRTNK